MQRKIREERFDSVSFPGLCDVGGNQRYFGISFFFFFLAVKRFALRRGIPSFIYSDNAKTSVLLISRRVSAPFLQSGKMYH